MLTGCNGSLCPCIHTEELYVRTDNQTVYIQDQTTRTPSLANPPIRTTPPGTPFTDPLHGILPGYGPTLRFVYVYVYETVRLRLHHNHCEQYTTASRDCPPLHHISNASPFIGSSFSGQLFSTWFDSQFLIWLDLIGVLIWLDSIVVSIWLDSLVYFNSI